MKKVKYLLADKKQECRNIRFKYDRLLEEIEEQQRTGGVDLTELYQMHDELKKIHNNLTERQLEYYELRDELRKSILT